jgi:hypothetical protein
MHDIIFDVVLDEDGKYCASAQTPDGLLCTDAPSLDALLPMLADLLALYAEDQTQAMNQITLRLPVPLGQAA